MQSIRLIVYDNAVSTQQTFLPTDQLSLLQSHEQALAIFFASRSLHSQK